MTFNSKEPLTMNSASDAEFFEELHGLLQEVRSQNGAAPLAERRRNERRTYQCQQLMAPQPDHNPPPASSFKLIDCYDLSSCGFSYCATEKPDFERLVVALGSVPFTFMLAAVRHIRTGSRNGLTTYTIGCQFLRRIV